MAAGGFLTRAFDTMLKESGGKKYPDLQKAIQAYQGQISISPIFARIIRSLLLVLGDFDLWNTIIATCVSARCILT